MHPRFTRRSTGWLSACLLGFIWSVAARADVTLASLFVDHAVLQRDKPVAIWGRAEAGEQIAVTFQDLRVTAAADVDGRWIVHLPAMPAMVKGADLVVSGQNRLVVHDVVVGEVWLCAGQSNMEFRVYDKKTVSYRVQNGPAEVAAATYPLIRHFGVAHRVAEKPLHDVAGNWAVCGPETVGDFTAVGYFFAREIFQRLNVPVGIINSSYGGTPIESWMPRDALDRDPAMAVVAERWTAAVAAFPAAKIRYEQDLAQWNQEMATAKKEAPEKFEAFSKRHHAPKLPPGAGPTDPWLPTGLFNGMISPLVPYSWRGVLWYQGESNAPRAVEYHRLFSAMISSWREHFAQGTLPFYWVQIASLGGENEGWPRLREAQAETLKLPVTGQAIAVDVGDQDDLHPKNKQALGHRLALIAAAKVYDLPGEFSGPVFSAATAVGNAMRVRFESGDKGLVFSGPPEAFEVAGADRKFHSATAVIEGTTLLVQSSDVSAPLAVRYAWRHSVKANLYNASGLPAGPFRSDRW